MKTQSLYVKAPWEWEVREVTLPDAPGPKEVLLRVTACGLCGTDLTAMAEGAAEWKPIGHEIAGVVEAVGPGVDAVAIGQQVVLESGSFCGRCALCRNGRVDLCRKAPNFWGQKAMGFSERMIVPDACLVPFEGLDPEVACQAEPHGVAYDMVKTADIQMGETVCVVGPGPIGLAAAALARTQAAARLLVIGLTRHERRLRVAAGLGCETLAVDEPLDQVKELAGCFDHVLMTAPVPFIAPALSLLAYGGEMTYIGIGQGSGTISFDANDFHFRKLQLRASFASPAIYFPAVLSLMRAGVMPGKELVSHIFSLEQAGELVALCRDRKSEAVKIVVTP